MRESFENGVELRSILLRHIQKPPLQNLKSHGQYDIKQKSVSQLKTGHKY